MLYTTLTVGGTDYKLRLNTKACVDLEKKLGSNPLNIFTNIASKNAMPELGDMITILHASMQPLQHKTTIDDVYNIYDKFVDEGNTLMELVPIILEIFKVSGFFKEEVEEDEKN